MDLFLLRIRKSRRHTREYIYQAIDTGQGQYSVYGRRAHGQAHFTPAGLGPPEATGQRAYTRRIAEGGLAQVSDQQCGALIDNREQILADLIGISNVDLNG